MLHYTISPDFWSICITLYGSQYVQVKIPNLEYYA